MRHGNHGAGAKQVEKGLLDLHFGLSIEGRGRLVQQDDRGVREQNAGKAEALPLPPESFTPGPPIIAS